MSRIDATTNFRDSNGVDLGKKLITKDYLMSVYPEIGQQIGIPPELWTWGYGTSGQLGNAAIINRSTPVTTFAGGTNWKQVACGPFQNAAIKTDGTLWTCGSGFAGVLGNASTINVSTPVTTFAGGTNWKQASCGRNLTSAIKTDGTLWTWGQGDDGKLGNQSTGGVVSTPVTTFAGGTNWKQVSCGGYHIAAIKTDGTLWIWGSNQFQQLGNARPGGLGNDANTPVTTFSGGNNWKQVSCGRRHTGAIKTDGTLWTWGRNYNGQLGTNNTTFPDERSTPVTTFAGGTNWKQVICNSGQTGLTLAIKTDGTLWGWGNGGAGQLGNNGSSSLTPVTTFAGGTNWKQVSAGYSHTAAIKTDGTLWAWGRGTEGQLGNNASGSNIPITTFAGGTNWKQVSCAGNSTAAIRSVDFAGF